MTGNDVRNTFLKYFERNGHKIVKSSPLLPANDPTLLFANAGMNQFKDVFLGAEKRDYKRATTSQKCVRAGGKHNDLDEVGKTSRHHTFFEMLGNFSFGDYFKEDAIRFAWELLVKEYKMDPERLWFSVFGGDDEVAADEEAIELWVKAGAPRERVMKFGRKDNFWQMGETGPCGPCSEIHYYTGENPNDPAFNKPEYVNGPGDDTVEIWNLVFMQYNRIETGPGQFRLDPLPAPSVDTGSGLERVTAVLQGVKSNYETDLIRPIIDYTAKLLGKTYVFNETDESVSYRVIADHARATAFLITDGVYPGNDGRGYVLRKIMRRAIWHGNRLGFKDLFFSKVTDFVTEMMGDAYPELRDARSAVERVVTIEEKLFNSTVSTGLNILEDVMKKAGDAKVISGAELFRLYDTYGLREDLISYVAEQRGFALDHAGFETHMDEQRRQARESWKGGAAKQINPIYQKIAANGRSQFTGYAGTELNGARVVAIVSNGESVNAIGAGKEGEVVLDRTPFYAQSGGQIGDRGVLQNDVVRALVTDTLSPTSGVIVHKVSIEQGELKTGDVVTAVVDAERRARTMANHTATHLLHAALREVLGTHVKQAGSEVAPERLRFDFTHFAPLTPAEIEEIERLVNDQTIRNTDVSKEEKTLDDAIAGGAMALFGEKYSEKVRVISVPGFSSELCGGTHVDATGDIGVFKIISNSSIASGTRRIEAVTGKGAFERFQQSEALLTEAAEKLNTATRNLPTEVERLQTQLKEQQREIERLKLKLAQGAQAADEQISEIKGVKVLARKVESLGKDGRRQLADSLAKKVAPGVVVLGEIADGAASLLVMVSKDATDRIQAGALIKELTAISGKKGGGKPDLAEGGALPEKLDETLNAVSDIVERLIK